MDKSQKRLRFEKVSKFAMRLRYIAVSKGTKARMVPADNR